MSNYSDRNGSGDDVVAMDTANTPVEFFFPVEECGDSVSDSEFEPFFISEHSDLTSCFTAGSQQNCSSGNLFLLVIALYIIFAVLSNLFDCYKFFMTWNLIVYERRLDVKGFQHQRRRLTMEEALKSHVTPEKMTCTFCCICLSDFYEDELVTSCDEGCRTWFHRECLFDWLDRSNQCPCCRKDMLAKKPRGAFGELAAIIGWES